MPRKRTMSLMRCQNCTVCSLSHCPLLMLCCCFDPQVEQFQQRMQSSPLLRRCWWTMMPGVCLCWWAMMPGVSVRVWWQGSHNGSIPSMHAGMLHSMQQGSDLADGSEGVYSKHVMLWRPRCQSIASSCVHFHLLSLV